MMNDKFDKILSHKIKQTLENREVEYNPEHWDMLLAKKEDKKRRFLFLWRFAGVAALLITVGITGKYLFSDSASHMNNEIEIVIEETNKDDIKKIDDIDKANITNGEIETLSDDVKIEVSKIDDVNNESSIQKIIINYPIKKGYDRDKITITDKNTNIYSETKKASLAYSEPDQKDSLTVNTVNPKIVYFQNEDENITKIETDKIIEDISKDSDEVADQKNIEEILADNEEVPIKKLNKKSLKIGLNVSPMINTIVGNSDSNIGFSSGITVEIPILKKFDIFTGILYTNQKFGLNQQQDVLALSDELSNSAGSVQLSAEEATLNGIEIPVNIKYNFAISKRKVFVSAGFSSTSYFKESTKTDYIVNTTIENSFQDSSGNNITQFRVLQSNETVISNENPDKGFDFASMLNFSFGMEFPVNKKRQSLVIEPYFKYSLKSITIKEFDYISAGFYLRYNFSFKNKE